MSDTRSVPLSEEQILFIEDLGKEFMRAKQHETATKLLAIVLAWKVALPIREPLENDPEFRCWIEESGGLAEIYDLHDFSKKVGA